LARPSLSPRRIFFYTRAAEGKFSISIFRQIIIQRGGAIAITHVPFMSSTILSVAAASVPYIKLIKCRDMNVDMGENEDWKISLQASGGGGVGGLRRR